MSEDDLVAPQDSWARVEGLFHESLSRPTGERGRFLVSACPDPAVRREVEELLAAHACHGAIDALSAEVISPLMAKAGTVAANAAVPVLDRYEIVDRLGGGGMGIVYRARDTRLNRDVALKFLPPHMSSEAAAKKRFLTEARAAASMEHPNICTVHEIGETADGQLYIVMGYYDGETLAGRISRGPIPVHEVISIAGDIARGLAKAHERGIVHRDIKPANIMLTSDGIVKILDFGIAKLSDHNITQTVGAIGTLAYMSPEQAFGEMVDARCDIWALGIVMHEMLTGRRPFQGPGQQAMLYSILTQDIEDVSATRSDVSVELDAVIRRALAKKPEDRFASAAGFAASLAAVALRPGDATRPGVQVTPPPKAQNTESLLARSGERRYAAVLSTAICDTEVLLEQLSGQELDELTRRVRDAATEMATRYGGIVNHFSDDEAVLLFGVAVSHEDDYLRAVRAAIDLHERVRTFRDAKGNAPVRLRSGIHLGAMVAQRQRSGDHRFRVSGAPLDVATRLASLAERDAILISPECQRRVGRHVVTERHAPVVLHGGAAPVEPYRVVGSRQQDAILEAFPMGALIPYAGRQRELAHLGDTLSSAVAGAGRTAVILGEAGAGKSRLLYEFRKSMGDMSARLLLGRCDAYGATTPHLPFIQAMRLLLEDDFQAAGNGAMSREDALAASVTAIQPALAEFLPLYCLLLGIPATSHPLPRHLQGEHLQSALLEALSALFTMQAGREPTVLLLEDWHWADEASRSALALLTEMAGAHALLVVVTARPEPDVDWPAHDHRTLLHLAPLNVEASLEIIRGVVGVSHVDPLLAAQLHERTGGNPFFLEETCQALVEEGAIIARDDVAVSAGTRAVDLPETIQAVIRTRLDRLDNAPRDLLRIASVIGREFSRSVLAEVSGGDFELAPAVDLLLQSGLIQQTTIVPEPAYRFKHVLTQEVAYDTLLEHQRKSLHSATAATLERRYADRLDEQFQRLAHHYSCAAEWTIAAHYGISAAHRSAGLSQYADALAVLDRTFSWVSAMPDTEARRDLTADVLLKQERMCETLGLRARQLVIVEDLIALLAPAGGSARLAEAYQRQGDVLTLLRRFEAADRALDTSLRLSRELGDKPGERNALRSIGLLKSHQGEREAAVKSIKEALSLDLELGETTAAAGDVASMGNVMRSMGRHHEALEALEEGLGYLSEKDDPVKWCAVMTVIASVHRDLGNDTEALGYLERSRDVAIERRLPIMVSFAMPGIANILLAQGRVEESLATYRQAADLSRRARHAEGLAQSLRALGEVLVGLGRDSEAISPLTEAAQLFAQLEDTETQALLRQRLAQTLERSGQHEEAQQTWELVRERSEGAGDPAGEALALEGIARCARGLGTRDSAIEEYQKALARAVTASDHRREVTLRNTLGLLRWEDGNYGEALRQYEAALSLCRQLGDSVHEGLILNSLGATLLMLKRYDEARTALESAIRINKQTGELRLEAHSQAKLGDVLLAAGRPDLARPAFERSLALRPLFDDRAGEGWMQERIARAARAAGEEDLEREATRSARAIASELDDVKLAAILETHIPTGTE